MSIPDLWPEDISHEISVIMPVNILREQASALTERTKGLLEGLVQSFKPNRPDEDFHHTLSIVAPALDNYQHTLLWVYHGISGYPARVETPDGQLRSGLGQDAFVETLKAIFAQDQTKRIIQALLAQSTL
jgi:hypothetical protein